MRERQGELGGDRVEMEGAVDLRTEHRLAAIPGEVLGQTVVQAARQVEDPIARRPARSHLAEQTTHCRLTRHVDETNLDPRSAVRHAQPFEVHRASVGGAL